MSYDTQQIANAAGLMANAAALNASVAGMVAENMQRQHRGESMAYISKDFQQEINTYGCNHNAIMIALGMHL